MNPTEKLVKKKFWTPYGVLAFLIILVFIISIPGGAPGRAAFIAKASNYVSQIDTACQAYRTEYGTLPPTSENYRLKKILCGDNPRGIPFITLKPSDLSPNGDMIDPWKTPFRIVFDPESKVHVISAGPDKIFGTPDDITND